MKKKTKNAIIKYTQKEKESLRSWKNRSVCANCGITNNTNYLTIHHILPKSKGGGNERSNLMILCRKCHNEVHSKYLFVSRDLDLEFNTSKGLAKLLRELNPHKSEEELIDKFDLSEIICLDEILV